MNDDDVWDMFQFFSHAACAEALMQARLEVVICMARRWSYFPAVWADA
jgi:hypothetical protein